MADFYVALELEGTGGEPLPDQHLALWSSASEARFVGANCYEHYRVYELTEVETVTGDDRA